MPTYDANGNQTLVKTATGIWTVHYDANNRPVHFEKTEGETVTVVECGYDSMGRRYMKKVTVNGTVTLHHRYIYRGYLQIACCDLMRGTHPCLWLVTWDPAEAEATRPLAIQKDGTWYCYGLDITKNVWEVFGSSGYIRTAYDYTPYGGVTEEGDVAQPVQWSSEMYDAELAMVYYNYRHYNPMDGRWINRDPKQGISLNLYLYITLQGFDLIGLSAYKIDDGGSSFHPTPDKGSGTHLSEPWTLRDATIVVIIREILPYYGLKYPKAADHLKHYLNNSGSAIHLDPADFKDNEYYRMAIEDELRELGQFAASLPEKGKNYPIVSTASTVGYFGEGDLFYAIGGFHIWGDGNICVNDNKYVAELTIHFYDSYNWDKGKQAPIPLPTAVLRWMVKQAVGTTGPIRIKGNKLIVEDEALARLHRQGLAKEFEIKGQETIRIEGTVGETSGTVSRGGGR